MRLRVARKVMGAPGAYLFHRRSTIRKAHKRLRRTDRLWWGLWKLRAAVNRTLEALLTEPNPPPKPSPTPDTADKAGAE